MARIKLTRFEPYQVSFDYATAWRLRVEAEAVDLDADPYVFLFRTHPTDPATGGQKAEFEAVCGPVELAQYPVDTPSTETAYPYMRQSWFEIDVPSIQDADAAWQHVVAEVDRLQQALALLAQMTPSQEVTVGAASPDSESA